MSGMTETDPNPQVPNRKPEGMTPAMRKAFEDSYKRNEELLRRLAKL